MSNVEQIVIECNNEKFIKGSYNGINILIRKFDNFINATAMCNQFNKKFRKIFENHAWQQYFEEFKYEYGVRPEMGEHVYELKKGYTNEIRGTYTNPKLINYIAFWASPKYAITVGKIMDKINERMQIKQIEAEENFKQIINNLQTELTSTKNHINNLNITIKRREGSLKIRKIKNIQNKDIYSITASRFDEQIIKNENEFVLKQYNSEETLNLLSFYVKNNCINNIEYNSKYSFITNNINTIINTIKDISDNCININIDYDKIIKNTIINWRNLNIEYSYDLKKYIFNYPKTQGTMFELYCAKKYNIPPFKYQQTELFGLNKKDIGCDLLNVKTSTTAQCKFYTESQLTQNRLDTYLLFIRKMNFNNNFLFINESLALSYDLKIPSYLDIIRVPDIEIYKFIDDICEKNIEWELEQKNIITENKTQTRIETEKHLENKIKKHKYKNKSDISNKININQDIKEFVKSYIYNKSMKGISLNDMIGKLKNEYNIDYNIYTFGKNFSDLYKHELNDSYPINNGEKWLFPILNSDLNEEIDFIYLTINHSEYLTKEYLDIHNKQFHTNYNIKSFSQQFGRMFKHDADCLARRTINGKRMHVFVLNDNNNENVYIDWIKKNIKEHNLITYIVSKFNEYFHCYYTNFMFIQTFKRFFKIENKAIRAPIDEINKYKNLYNIDIETTPTRIYSL